MRSRGRSQGSDPRVESALEEVEYLVCSAVEHMEEDSTGLVGVGSLRRLVLCKLPQL